MRISFLFLILGILIFTGCKSDKTSDSSDLPKEEINMDDIDIDENEDIELEVDMDKAIEEEALAKKMLVESKKKEVDEIAKVEDRNETKLEGKSQEQIEKEEKLKKEATKELIEGSVNRGKTCEQILKEQTKMVDDYATSKDIQIILQMEKSQNDAFFIECRKAPGFQDKIDELTDRIEKILEGN